MKKLKKKERMNEWTIKEIMKRLKHILRKSERKKESKKTNKQTNQRNNRKIKNINKQTNKENLFKLKQLGFLLILVEHYVKKYFKALFRVSPIDRYIPTYTR